MVFYFMLANYWLQQNQKILSTREIETSACSTFDWPVVKTNKDSVSTWESTISGIRNSYGTLRQSIRWTSKSNYHRKVNATVNADQTVIHVKVLETEIRRCAADTSISSNRCKKRAIYIITDTQIKCM